MTEAQLALEQARFIAACVFALLLFTVSFILGYVGYANRSKHSEDLSFGLSFGAMITFLAGCLVILWQLGVVGGTS